MKQWPHIVNCIGAVVLGMAATALAQSSATRPYDTTRPIIAPLSPISDSVQISDLTQLSLEQLMNIDVLPPDTEQTASPHISTGGGSQ
jgi:hypothetical protein